jgi:transcriptional regulator with XRE-family HTH domain
MYDLGLILQTFGAKVRLLRQSKGLSQMDLARAAGLHRTYIADVERGGRNSSMGSIAKIAWALGVSIADLCHGIEH